MSILQSDRIPFTVFASLWLKLWSNHVLLLSSATTIHLKPWTEDSTASGVRLSPPSLFFFLTLHPAAPMCCCWFCVSCQKKKKQLYQQFDKYTDINGEWLSWNGMKEKEPVISIWTECAIMTDERAIMIDFRDERLFVMYCVLNCEWLESVLLWWWWWWQRWSVL